MESPLLVTNGTSDGQGKSGPTIFLFFLFVIAVVIWIILSFTQKRTSACHDCCWGLPGTVSAVNFLNPQHRIIYALVFGAFTSQFISLAYLVFTNEFVSTADNKYVEVFVKALLTVVAVLLVALLCYPLFACVEAPIRLVGYILGSLYSDLYAIYSVYSIIYTLVNDSKSDAIGIDIVRVVSLVPQLVCLVLVLVWYHAKAINESARVYTLGRDALFLRAEQSLHEDYVRNLLNGWRAYPGTGHQLKFGKGFHFPFPFLIAIVIVTLLILQLTVQVVVGSLYLLSRYTKNANKSENPDAAAIVQKMTAVMIIMPLAAAVLVYVLFFHLVYVMRKRMKALWAGKDTCDIDFHRINWPSFTLASAVRYTGVQIASVIFAWTFYTIMFVLVGLFFVLLSIYPDEVWFLVYILAVVILWTAGILGAQILIVKLFFVHEESHNTHTIVIRNRRVFSCFAYVVLLYNIAVGIMFNLLRLMLSCLITATVLLRMDRPLMISGFELTDLGLKLYKSFITVETLLGNPVVCTFVNILKREGGHNYHQPTTIQDQSYRSGYGAANPVSGLSTTRYSCRALNRWMVAYTLINNKSLVSLRARNINASGRNLYTEEKDLGGGGLYVAISDTSSGEFPTSQE